MITLLITLYLRSVSIMEANKNLDPAQAFLIAYYAKVYSVEYNVPTKVYLGVLKVESRFILSAENKRTKDSGIAQINDFHKLDKFRLTHDYKYSIKHGARILGWFKKKYPKNYVARYNCGVKKNCVNTKTAQKYRKKVLDFVASL